ncbi:MAG: type 1 glutamine amidotransferase [Desulfobacterales bacterium]|nr:MAG: type 1 glutamine amidotransferase [Desulfobacterales bacterium]
MRIQLIEHDPEDFSRTNISFWAARKGCRIHQTYVCKGEAWPSLDDFDWLMVMGGSQHAWDEPGNAWLQEEKHYVAKALASGKPFLGICFGAQILAEALGGHLFPNQHREIGWYEVKLTRPGRESFLFNNIPASFVSFHWHSDHFSLPRSCTRLAFSEATENQAFICNDRPAVGLQFHPEYTREMVAYYTAEHSQDWIPDVFVSPKEQILTRTEKIQDTYWLMETLLNNMAEEFEIK